jgi:hypothetical protein
MPTPTDQKTGNPNQDYYNDKFNEIAGANSDLKNAEKNAEKTNEGDRSNSPEASFYNNTSNQNGRNFKSLVINKFKKASNAKKVATAGGVVGGVVLVVSVFAFLQVFQLVNLDEQFKGIFEGQTRRVISSRAAQHYRLAIDEDGSSYYKKTGLRGKLGKAYSAMDPEKIRTDLRTQGVNIDIDIETGKFRINGQVVEGKLSDQRNVLTAELNKAYANEDAGFIKRSMRSRTAFKSMGIQRTFFENTKRSASDAELAMIKKIRDRFSGDADLDARKVRLADAEAQQQADELATNLKDPAFDPGPLPSPDSSSVGVNVATSVGAAGTIKGIGSTAKLDSIASSACEIKFYLKSIELLAIIYRHKALIENAGMIMVAAHQLKTGENVTTAEVGALLALLNRNPGIGSSGSWQLLAGDKNAKVKYTDELALSLTNSSGAGGYIADLNAKADSILGAMTIENDDGTTVGAENYCRLSRNMVYNILSSGLGAIVQVGGTLLSGGTISGAVAIKAGITITLQVGLEIAKSILKPVIARNIAGTAAMLAYGPSQGGDKAFDALSAGAMGISMGANYQNGMTEYMTPEKVAKVESAIALEKQQNAKQQNIYTKYIALNNPDSLLTKKLMTMPSTPKSAFNNVGSNLATLPSAFANSLLLFTPHGKAMAQSSSANPYMVANPMGIPMYGMPDDTLNEINSKYSDPVANEESIYDTNEGINGYFAWRDKCFPSDSPGMLYGLASDEDEEQILNECTFGTYQTSQTALSGDGGMTTVAGLSSEERDLKLRYATYHLDRTILQGNAFITGQTDCTDPDSEDFNCTDQVDTATDTNNNDTPNTEGWTWPISEQDFVPINASRCYDPAPPGTGHTGIDIAVNNKAVYSANSGKVLEAKKGAASGNYVLIDHQNGYYSHYQHLSSFSVKAGDTVNSGQQIGVSGNTGNSTGPHLHFGISTTASLNSLNNTGSAIEPTKFLPPREGNPCN